MDEVKTLNIEEIKKLLPHRYPFLLVDRVKEFVKNKHIIAIKNVTVNEEFFQGHFPNYPIMPGVLIIEALAQSCALFYLLNSGNSENNKNVFFMSIDDCKFRKPVVPGDSLLLKAHPINTKGPVSKLKTEAYVDDKVVCEAILTAMIK